MTQLQFEMIIKIIESGAPALAQELCTSLNNLVIERNNLDSRVMELEQLVAKEEKKTKTEKTIKMSEADKK